MHITGGNTLRAATSGCISHLGPAVNKKPTMNSGIKLVTIVTACAVVGATAHASGEPIARAAKTAPHHNAQRLSTSEPEKKAKRCGAASNHDGRQGDLCGCGNCLPASAAGGADDVSTGIRMERGGDMASMMRETVANVLMPD